MAEYEKSYIDELIRLWNSERLMAELTKINEVLDSTSRGMYAAIWRRNKREIQTLWEVQERLWGYKKAISDKINEIL